MRGLADKARAAGARIVEGVEVTGFEQDGSGAVTRVETSAGPIEVEQVVVAVGPWIPVVWEMLGLADRIDVHRPDGSVDRDVPMWTYWYLQEGEVALPPSTFDTADGERARCCTSTPTCRSATTEARPSATGRGASTSSPTAPRSRGRPAAAGGGANRARAVPDRHRRGGFPDLWCAALSRTVARFEGCRSLYRQVRSGGAGAFTADNFPVFDHMRPNVYVAADSNHGYKMIAVGREIARVLQGEHSTLLHPFRFERFATGTCTPSRTARIRGAEGGRDRATS